jgi:hypothetical protein
LSWKRNAGGILELQVSLILSYGLEVNECIGDSPEITAGLEFPKRELLGHEWPKQLFTWILKVDDICGRGISCKQLNGLWLVQIERKFIKGYETLQRIIGSIREVGLRLSF